ncbi:HNH endonuclease signature motif containing protein [Pedococcus bigeumensis]|uniref:HNH endonuclease n=1 Tax=Pedococcus bigeumensis TaxID=433644 RepID=A0A502CXC2_9MICO|nr:HNH endonuclease signature motif containing protein [Pedococcus bigeumensis]TPG17292.1 HNH endonuclease [Pedococcus bigeumensis]
MAAVATLRTAPIGTVDVLREIEALLDRVHTGDVCGGPAAATALGEVERVISRLQAVRLSLVAEADRSGVAAGSGLTGTSAWLAVSTRRDGGQAARDVRLATALDNGLPATREALAAGDVSTDHAQVIATATAQLPDGLSQQERAAIETDLVRRAKLVDPGTLRKEGRRILSVTERSQAEVDAHEDRVLRTEEDAAVAKTRLTWHHNGDGTTTGHFTVPTLAASILAKTVQQIASPRRFAQQAARAATAAGAGTPAAVQAATWDAFRAADGDWAHRYGKAFVELLEHLPTDALSGKVAATVLVTIDHDQLMAGVGAAHLDTGQDLSAGEARRLACNAGIVPAVLGGRSVPLDLGRQERFFTEAQRVALATTYDTCAAEACDRPYAWSELHHEDPWASGGRTDLALAVPLCGHHHRRVHDPHYAHRIDTNHRGRKSVIFALRT